MRFGNNFDEAVYMSLLEDTGEGDVHSPVGWFCPVDLEPGETRSIKHYGARHLIVREDSDGFVAVVGYDVQEKRDLVLDALRVSDSLFNAGISGDEATEAIGGYIEAAYFTATDEAGDPIDPSIPFSPDAQRTMRSDVIDFITSNAEDCHEFMEVTGHDWTQVGIDFNFTRNGLGAGFWDRGAGEVGKRLTEMSKPHGDQFVYLQDDGELGVS